MKKYVLIALLSTASAIRLEQCDIEDFNLKYPELFRGQDSDVHPGSDFTSVSVQDPYRILEDPENKLTVDWIKKENALTDSYMKKLPNVKELSEKLLDNYQYTKFELPMRHGKELYVITKEGKKGSH